MQSEILIVDVETGEVEVLLETDRLIEAPNWTPDGSALIVNGDGHLFHVPLDAPALNEMDTGFAVRCNNDHGISPDGKTLVISDQAQTSDSCIYTMPFSGGTLKKITQDVPSYWHGWSPDGQQLVYTARRDGGSFNIYVIPVEGGTEKLLTSGYECCDGPDFTPDGEWIWFNGEKDGRVELWRMRPDGRGLERMTDDEAVNWFPHPSPDGKTIIYIAFPPKTEGHPRDKYVQIRTMSANGGPTTKVLDLFGGQGTMNVPNWAPDSRRFACVRYAVK